MFISCVQLLPQCGQWRGHTHTLPLPGAADEMGACFLRDGAVSVSYIGNNVLWFGSELPLNPLITRVTVQSDETAVLRNSNC